MKVAFIMPTHFDLASVIAGGERYAYGLAKAMSAKTPTCLFTFSNQQRVVQDDRLNIRYEKIIFPVGGIANPLSIGFVRALSQYDIIHCLQFKTLVTDFAMMAGALLKKKVFVTDLAGGTYYCPSHFIPIWKKANGFLYISEFNRNLNQSIKASYRILYCGVDTRYFKPPEERFPRDKFLFVGRIFRSKGVHDLIDAATPQMKVEIAGTCHDADYMNELKLKSKGKNISFHEGISDGDLLFKIQTSLATVLPSLVDGGFTSAIESMACETPVIGTRLGSLPEVVEDGATGWIVPPANPMALREKMESMLKNPNTTLGASGRKRVLERFTWDHVAERCLSAYKDL